MTETQKMTVSKFTQREHIPYIFEEILTLLKYSFTKEEELEISRTTLMTLNNIEYVKREIREALGRHDASEGRFDNTTNSRYSQRNQKKLAERRS